MSVLEAKKVEIHQILDQAPEYVIDDVLEFLHNLKQEPEEGVSESFMQALNKVMEEDHELLKRLAQ
jgi:mevalonate kinase